MENDKRHNDDPIPKNLEDWLSQDQLDALKQISNFGWELKFVRRPAFQDPVAVIFCADGNKIGVLEKDGKINMNPDITIRD